MNKCESMDEAETKHLRVCLYPQKYGRKNENLSISYMPIIRYNCKEIFIGKVIWNMKLISPEENPIMQAYNK